MEPRDPATGASDHGATAVEYALMLALIFLVIITAVALLGGNLNNLFANETLTSGLK